jgi:uncharacterized protein (TIGR02996 family)
MSSGHDTVAGRPEVLAFLGAIKEQPEDDLPRLVLADWLEERGDPRGELVRQQVMLAHVIPGSSAGQKRLQREKELRRLHERDWLGRLAALADSWTCVRGLVQLTLAGATFLGNEFAQLARTELVAWVDGARVTCYLPAMAIAVASSPLLAGLNLLNMGGQIFDAAAAEALAASEHVRNLTVLELYATPLGAAGARALARSPHLAKLRHLDLDGCIIGDEGALALARSPHLNALVGLQLRNNRLETSTLAALRARPGLRLVV